MSLEGSFGASIQEPLGTNLTLPMALNTLRAIERHRSFEILGAYQRQIGNDVTETLIVECVNDEVPTRNKVGIAYREHLALRFHGDEMPRVYALRADFPVTYHQNVSENDYRDLCLYEVKWKALRRSWTPAAYLETIRQWLARTASGTLHAPDQNLEQLFFSSAYHLVLPHDFDAHIGDRSKEIVVEERLENNIEILTCAFVDKAEQRNSHFTCLAITLDPVIHGSIDLPPSNLEELRNQVERRGVQFIQPLSQAIIEKYDGRPLPENPRQYTLLIVNTPLRRAEGEASERIDRRAFVIHNDIGHIADAIGVAHKQGDKYFIAKLLTTAGPPVMQDLSKGKLTMTEVLLPFTPEHARDANGLTEVGPKGVVAGVGALGSEIMNLWVRSGWGRWTVIDDDWIRPHNLARHQAREKDIGSNKATCLAKFATALFPRQEAPITAIAADATNFDDPRIKEALGDAALVVDVTTTLEFPRDLAARDAPRSLTLFVTPSSQDAVMFLEDRARTTRLDILEAQYYRRLIQEPWGAEHLVGNRSHIVAGAGCRDFSLRIPNEQLYLHAANLAGAVRRRAAEAGGGIFVWSHDEKSGAVAAYSFEVVTPLVSRCGDYQIVWDEAVREKIRKDRADHLPKETGGVFIGYFDEVPKRVYIVDALPAPPDSKRDAASFVRGKEGLVEAIAKANQRTGNIVQYVGEWHSHPPGSAASPSDDDELLLVHLALALVEDGHPAVMLIAGDKEENWFMAGELDIMKKEAR